MAVRIDVDKCTGCGACVEVCPVQALEVKGAKVTVNDNCVDCGACLNQCPVAALSF